MNVRGEEAAGGRRISTSSFGVDAERVMSCRSLCAACSAKWWLSHVFVGQESYIEQNSTSSFHAQR
jgi:hypothetical protein